LSCDWVSGVNGKKTTDNIKKHLSSFVLGNLEHAHQWIIAENIGTHLAIDEVALSQGELYTIVTNKRLR
jgi:hypothetical protein